MAELTSPIRSLRSQRARPLSGTFVPPGDPALAMRALLISAMALGKSRVTNLPDSTEVAAMVTAVEALGVRVERKDDAAVVCGLGVGGLLEPLEPLDAGASDDLAALLLGTVGIYPFGTGFIRAARPAGALLDALQSLGIAVDWNDDRSTPLSVRGPCTPLPGAYAASTPESLAAMLMAAVSTAGVTRITAPASALDHTRPMLAAFGANITTGEGEEQIRTIRVEGLPDLRGRDLVLPGDPVWSAMGMAAGLIVPGSVIAVAGVLLQPGRSGTIDLLVEMGADLSIGTASKAGGEDVATVTVRHGALAGIVVPPERSRALGPELPMIALVASFARGDTVIEGLNAGDIDGWVGAFSQGLSANGVRSEVDAGRLVIHGNGRITGGGRVAAHPDARVALAFTMMGMATRDPVVIDDPAPLEAEYPGALGRLAALGAGFRREGP